MVPCSQQTHSLKTCKRDTNSHLKRSQAGVKRNICYHLQNIRRHYSMKYLFYLSPPSPYFIHFEQCVAPRICKKLPYHAWQWYVQGTEHQSSPSQMCWANTEHVSVPAVALQWCWKNSATWEEPTIQVFPTLVAFCLGTGMLKEVIRYIVLVWSRSTREGMEASVKWSNYWWVLCCIKDPTAGILKILTRKQVPLTSIGFVSKAFLFFYIFQLFSPHTPMQS